MNCNLVKHLLSKTLKPQVAKVFMDCVLKLLKTKFLVPSSFILQYSYSSLKIFENKVVNMGETELTNASHDLYTLLTAIFQE